MIDKLTTVTKLLKIMNYMFPLNIPKLESQKANLVGNIFLIHRAFRSREGHGQQVGWGEKKKTTLFTSLCLHEHIAFSISTPATLQQDELFLSTGM